MTIRIHSGGAQGADTWFEYYGCKQGIEVIKYSFFEHDIKITNYGGIQHILDDEQLYQFEGLVKQAATRQERKYSNKSEYVKKLLLRNAYQVINSDLIVAVSSIQDFENIKVKGGTGWAVATASILDKPIYVFDQNLDLWYDNNKRIGLQKTETDPIISDCPDDIAGIGSRYLNISGKEAIKYFFQEGNDE